MLVVWRIVERVGRRHGLAADTACAGVRAAVAIVMEIFEVGSAVVLRDVGRFGMPTVGADAAFVKVMLFDDGHRITAGAEPLVTVLV